MSTTTATPTITMLLTRGRVSDLWLMRYRRLFQLLMQRGIVLHPKGKLESGCGWLRLNAINRLLKNMDKSELITCDSANLIKSFKKTIKASADKHSTKRLMLHQLDEISRAQNELHTRKWKVEETTPFIINERGHVRKIQGNTPYDRMIIHSYVDYSLQPLLEPHLIYDNYASQDKKGTSLARSRFESYLHKAYREFGNNKFYIQLIDFSKFYDNVQHEKLKEELFKYIPDEEFHRYMLDTILDSFKVDVSYMTDEEYSRCLDEKYVALDHMYDKPVGDKYMAKSINIGNQASQIFSIFYPTRIDNYCKIVKGIKYYGRYMDDIYVISDSKDDLRNLLEEIKSICHDMGLYINEKKTQIFRVDKPFKFLNRVYSLSESGHLFVSLSNSTYNRERRKLKRFKRLLDDGAMEYSKIENQFKSWLGGNKKYINKAQLNQITKLYDELFKGGESE